MIKKSWLVVIIVLLSFQLAFASNASLEKGKYGDDAFGASSLLDTYEGNLDWYTLAVDNFLESTTIDKVILSTPGFTVNGVTNFTEWGYTTTTSSIEWFGGTIETNVLAAIFEFELRAPQVAEDSNFTLTLQLRDTLSDIQNLTFDVTVRNDATPPTLSQAVPANGSTLPVGQRTVSVIVDDAETGVAEAEFSYNDCVGGDDTVVALTCSGTNCSASVDFSGFGADTQICFAFNAENNAGLASSLEGEAMFDVTPPTVSLVDIPFQPTAAQFNVSGVDNLATSLTCELFINDVSRQVQVFPVNTTGAFNESISDVVEGSHRYNVTCVDGVGLEGTANSTFWHDPHAPLITLNSPANGSTVKDTTIDISVTDNTSLASITYSQSLNTSSWVEGQNDLTVTAEDAAGNRAQEVFTFYKDLTAPNITLISPANGSSSDNHVNFTLRVDDDFASNVTCTVVTDQGVNGTAVLQSGVQSTIQVTLPIGSVNWYVTCVDQVGNEASTGSQQVTTVDTSGPDIIIKDIVLAQRGQATTISANITDYSGVAIAYALFGAQNITLTANDDTYTGTLTPSSGLTLGNYTYTIFAEDTLGYQSQANDTFHLVLGVTINFSLSPNPVNPGGEVVATGVIGTDDGQNLSGQHVQLTHPNGVFNITILDDNSFSGSFNNPNEGTFNITVSYETVDLVYQSVEVLTVNANGGASGGGGGNAGDNFDGSQEDSFGAPTVKEPSFSTQDSGDSTQEAPDNNANDASDSLVEDVTEEPQEPEEERNPVGVGAATGLFNLQKLKGLWWILLLVAGILAVLYYFSREGPPKMPTFSKKVETPEDEGGIDWDNYFERHNGP